MLATYAMHLLLWQQGPKDLLERFILSHHTEALASVRYRLDSLDKNALEGVLPAIAALACYAHLIGDPSIWKIHMSAINRIINSRHQSLDRSRLSLLSLLQWYVNYLLGFNLMYRGLHL